MYRREDVLRWTIASILAIALISGGTYFAPPDRPVPRPYSNVRPPDPGYTIEFPRLDEEEPEPPEVQRQIVTVYLPPTEAIPDDARFEDRFNRDVEEETVAREQAPPGSPEPEPSPDPGHADETRGDDDQVDSVPSPSRRGTARPRGVEPAEDQMAAVDDAEGELGALPAGEVAARPDPNVDQPSGEEDGGGLRLSGFNPTAERAAEFIGVPGATLDHLDLPQGDRTQIDSIENMYWAYWERIKNQVRHHWQPATVYRNHDPTGRIYGVEDRYTVLRVTLNGDGSLRHVYLERSSDLDFLDREAIQAIREAEPFSNVPEGLKDDNGMLSFTFGFFFEVASSSFRIRREDW